MMAKAKLPALTEILIELNKLALERKAIADELWLVEHKGQELMIQLEELLNSVDKDT